MTKVLYSTGQFWVCKAKHGYEVYENGVTHSTRRAIIGWEGEKGLSRAIAEADRRQAKETPAEAGAKVSENTLGRLSRSYLSLCLQAFPWGMSSPFGAMAVCGACGA